VFYGESLTKNTPIFNLKTRARDIKKTGSYDWATISTGKVTRVIKPAYSASPSASPRFTRSISAIIS